MRLRVAVPIALLIARARHQAQGSKKDPGRLSTSKPQFDDGSPIQSCPASVTTTPVGPTAQSVPKSYGG